MPFPNPDTQFKAGDKLVEMATRGGRKGGLVKSDRKTLAAKVRWLKKRASEGDIKVEEINHLVECVENPTISILDILNDLDEIKNECKNPNQKILLADARIKLHKAHFGEKVKSENLNLNVNVGLEEWERRLAQKFHGTNNEE